MCLLTYLYTILVLFMQNNMLGGFNHALRNGYDETHSLSSDNLNIVYRIFRLYPITDKKHDPIETLFHRFFNVRNKDFIYSEILYLNLA